MEPIRVLREGKETFCEWRFENGQPLGRILNQGEGVFLEKAFSSIAEAKLFCERELEMDASLIFYVLRGGEIIEAVQNQAYQIAYGKRLDRFYAAVSATIMMLVALIVSVLFMPFQTTTSHLLFVGGIGLFYLFLFLVASSWHLESMAATLLLLILLSVLITLFT